MKIKEIERTVNIAWSPANHHPVMLAAGTAAQQLDSTFSTTSALEIYELNLGEPGLDMKLCSSAASDFRFHKIAWSPYSRERDGGGLIVGGCDGGRLQIYSSAKLLSGDEGLVGRQDKHAGPVRALDFNPYQPNLLASGASDSEIFIWDMNNIDTPMLPGAKSQPADDVLWISWNKQVQHILASTFAQRCVVWDLRKNEPIIKLTDSTSRVCWKVIAWHPEVATQLCLASEEDQTPVIQLWDLRFATSPLKVFDKHQRGVSSIAWCPQDSDLLISCGKDNRILCWNPNSNAPGGEVVCDIATTNQWHFDVTWCPRNPVLIASSSYDGHVSVYSLMGGQQQVQTTNKIADSFPGMETYAQAPPQQQQQVAVELLKAPKWLKKCSGASFGFGGKLISFGNESTQPAATAAAAGNQTNDGLIHRYVFLSQVVTEGDLITRSIHLEQALNNNLYMDFCHLKISQSKSAHEESIWKFLKANFSGNPRSELLNLLGFQPEEIALKVSKYTDKPANARPEDGVETLANQMATLGRQSDASGGVLRSSEEHRSSPRTANTEASATFDAIAASNFLNGPNKFEVEPYRISTANDADGLISQSLLVGDIESAVNICLEEERYADAIILAMTGGSELLANTQYRYLKKSKGFLKNIITSVVMEDWSHVVKTCSVDSWKEALAGVLTYTKNEEFVALSEILGERLETEGDGHLSLNAQLCYIISGNLSKLVENWTSLAQTNNISRLQELVELAMLLQKAIGLQGRSAYITGKLAALLSQYAQILASQGELDAALSYLNESQDPEVEALRERLLCSLGHKQAYQQSRQKANVKPVSQQIGSRKTSGSGYPGQVQPQFQQTSTNSYPQPGPPQPSFAPPQQTSFAPPQQTSFAPPPQPSFASPQQTSFAPPQQTSFAPPPQASFAPPPQTSFPPASQPNFAPPPQQPLASKPYGSNMPTQSFAPSPSSQSFSQPSYPQSPLPPPATSFPQPVTSQPFTQRPPSQPSASHFASPGQSFGMSRADQQMPPQSLSSSSNLTPLRGPSNASSVGMPPVGSAVPPSYQSSNFPSQSTPPPPPRSVTPVQGMFRPSSPWEYNMYQKSPRYSDGIRNSPKWSGGPQRSKYVVDPSVQSSSSAGLPSIGGSGRMPYSQSSAPYQAGPGGPVPTFPVAQQNPAADMYNPADIQSPVAAASPALNMPQNFVSHNSPPGWNDPPVIRNAARNQRVIKDVGMSAEHAGTRRWNAMISRSKVKPEPVAQSPITHPLFGTAPPGQGISPVPSGHIPGQMHPEPMPGMLPPNNMQINGAYGDPPQSYQFKTVQSQNTPPRQMTPPVRQAEPPKPKEPVPEEYMYLQTVFDELRNRCSCAASNAQTKRKLEDVARRLEVLYDSLRESKLSQNTLQGLHQLVQMVQIGDYQGGLGLHTQLVSSPDFAQISGFMPGLKVLLQVALQLQVYLQ